MNPAAIPVGYVTERGETVPGWYARNPHTDLSVVVKQDGVPLLPQFTVGQVAPERRWPIGPDGELLYQVQFRQKVIEKNEEFYAIVRAQGRNAKPAQDYDFKRDPVPRVECFVQWRVDEEDETKLLEIHYDPHKGRGAKPDHFVDSEGKKVEGKKIEHLCAAYADPTLRAKLRPEEIAEVEAHLDLQAGPSVGGISAKLELLTKIHDAGEISDESYMARVAALTGAGPRQAEAQAAPAQAPTEWKKGWCRVPCGAKGIIGYQKKKHIESCEVCSAAESTDST
jgi:hypothetical protein